jgi:hypothetical protein
MTRACGFVGAAMLLLTGCGTYVPGLQEPLQSAVDGQQLVQGIVQNIDCEIRQAIGDVIRQDEDDVRIGVKRHRQTAWLDEWGVEMTLNLEVSERSGVNPSIDWFPASPANAVFTLGAGAGLSAEATRVNKMGSYYTVYEIMTGPQCIPASRPGGPFLMQSDLKLREWLLTNVMLDGTGVSQQPRSITGPFKQDVLQHRITFEVVSSGSLAPAWRLTRSSLNQGGSLFGASRTRKHDLLLTLGPANPVLLASQKRKARVAIASQLLPARATAASNAHLASEIGIAVSSALRTSPR